MNTFNSNNINLYKASDQCINTWQNNQNKNINVDGKILFEIEEDYLNTLNTQSMKRKGIRIMSMYFGY